MQRRAQVQPSTIDEERRTVEVIFSTGERVLRGWLDQYWEELSLDPAHVRMERLTAGRAPVLDAHGSFSTDDVIGVVDSASLEDGRGVATLRFASDEKSDAVFRKIREGILHDVSVGYRIHRIEEISGDEEGQVPTLRATDWEPFEISVVPIGADSGAKVRGDDGAGGTNPCEVITRASGESTIMKKKERSVLKTRADEKPEDETAEDAADETSDEEEEETAADETAASGESEERSLVAQERARGIAIRRICEKLELPVAFGEQHIERGTALNKFRALAIDAKVKEEEESRPTVRVSIPAGGDTRERSILGMTNALLVRSGRIDVFRKAAEKRGEKFDIDGGEYRGMSLIDMARAVLERSGVNVRGRTKKEIAGMALSQRSEGGFHATGDFPVVLENVMHKSLQAAYAITPDTWRQVCLVGSLSDFRPHHRYRMGTFGRLDVVLENGEFQNKAIDDAEKESITAETVGNIVSISRQALVNDDMGALTGSALKLGRAAALSIEVDFYALLALNGGLGPIMADGDTLFHANHGNIGVGSVLSVEGIDADRVVMAEQMDPSGNEFLDLRPSVLVLPVGLGGAARVINQSQYDVDPAAGGTNNHNQKPNKVVGLYETIVDTPRVSGTRRYSFAGPNVAPVVEVGFLDGESQPYLEMREGFRVDGVEWKVRLDYGIAAIDFRGAVTNSGADES